MFTESENESSSSSDLGDKAKKIFGKFSILGGKSSSSSSETDSENKAKETRQQNLNAQTKVEFEADVEIEETQKIELSGKPKLNKERPSRKPSSIRQSEKPVKDVKKIFSGDTDFVPTFSAAPSLTSHGSIQTGSYRYYRDSKIFIRKITNHTTSHPTTQMVKGSKNQ